MVERGSLVAFGLLALFGSVVSADVAVAAMPAHAVEPDATMPATPSDPPPTTPRPAVVFAEGVAGIRPPSAALDADEVECVAKVIVHEAGNQPYRGQQAVAQVIRTRMKSGRFAESACGVVRQAGQFFDVDAYDPPRTGARWATAVEIATDTLNGEGDDVVPGALFFRSSGTGMPRRTRVARIAAHAFYR